MPDRQQLLRFSLFFALPVIVLLLIQVIIYITLAPREHSVLFAALSLAFLCVLGYFLFHAYHNERRREDMESEIKDCLEKYRSLVETSTDGTVLVLDHKMIHANLVLLAMTGYTSRQFRDLKFEDVFRFPRGKGSSLDQLIGQLEGSGSSLSLEATIRHKRGDARDVILSISRFEYADKQGIVGVVKDVTGKDRIRSEKDALSDELQTSILLMNLPVTSLIREHVKCSMDDSIRESAQLMERKKQDAILITKNEGDYIGIVTDTDLRNRVVSRDMDPNKPVFEIMSSPLLTISEDSLLFEALLMVQEKGISHLAVTSKKGEVLGIFSKEDLHEVQRNTISYLVREIRNADSVDSLKRIYGKVPGLIKTLLDSGGRIQTITHMISTISDVITERLIGFGIEDMGEPPARFAFIAMGSEGRREQTMVTDQDNAIIFEDVHNEQLSRVNKYFLYLGRNINDWLNRIGYDYCEGEVMAGNPQWCQPLERWKRYFTNWITNSSVEDLLGVSIFFDFRVVYGDHGLGEELRTHIHRTARKKNRFFQHLIQNTQSYKPPLDLLREQQQEIARTGHQDFIDIKVAVRPFIEFVRIYALRNELPETSTLLMLERLLIRGVIDKKEYDDISHAYSTLTEIRFRAQLEEILDNKPPDNYIKPNELKEIEKTLLRKILSGVSTCQSRLAIEFRELP